MDKRAAMIRVMRMLLISSLLGAVIFALVINLMRQTG